MQEEFASLNKETGMLGDPEEIRHVALLVISSFKRVLSNPFISMILPIGVKLDLAALIVNVESLLHTMSQAAYLRQLALVSYGYIGPAFEEELQKMGYSEVLPTTHPNAPHPVPPPMDPNSREVRDSMILQEILKREYEQSPGPTQPPDRDVPRTELPPGLDEFLKGLIDPPKEEK